MKALNKVWAHLKNVFLKTLLMIIRAYQLFLSPVLGSNCRFYPSCSNYCRDALIEFGFIKGVFLTLKRILKCHPGHPGGYDPIPKKSL